MPVIIRDRATNDMIRKRAERDGVGLTAVVKRAMQEYEARREPDDKEARFARLRRRLEEWDRLPVLDPRSSKELIDDLYDESGLPK